MSDIAEAGLHSTVSNRIWHNALTQHRQETIIVYSVHCSIFHDSINIILAFIIIITTRSRWQGSQYAHTYVCAYTDYRQPKNITPLTLSIRWHNNNIMYSIKLHHTYNSISVNHKHFRRKLTDSCDDNFPSCFHITIICSQRMLRY